MAPRWLLLALGLVLGAGALSGLAPTDEPALADAPSTGVIHEAPSAFNRRVFVVDHRGLRSMRFGSRHAVDQSRIRRGHPEQLPMPYLRSATVGLAVPDRLERLLVIGLGGGAFPAFLRARLPTARIDAVEIDPVVARIAAEYFDLVADERLAVHVTDAVEYVKDEERSYDYILLDAYDADDMPAALITTAFLSDFHARLGDGGIAVVNIASTSAVKTREIILKVTAHFGHCVKLRSRPSLNDVLLLADRPLPPADTLRAWATGFDPDDELGLQAHIDTLRPCL